MNGQIILQLKSPKTVFSRLQHRSSGTDTQKSMSPCSTVTQLPTATAAQTKIEHGNQAHLESGAMEYSSMHSANKGVSSRAFHYCSRPLSHPPTQRDTKLRLSNMLFFLMLVSVP
jgi:hypothetical protein